MHFMKLRKSSCKRAPLEPISPMEADFCLLRHLRPNPIFSKQYNRPPIFDFRVDRRPLLRTRFLKTRPTILAAHHNRSPAFGFHTYPQSFYHLSLDSLQSFPLRERPTRKAVNALPLLADNGGDGATARAAALATTAVILACVLGGISLKGVARGMVGLPAMAGMVATPYPLWLSMPVGARAVQALLDTSDGEALTEEELNEAKRKFRQQMQAKKRINYRELQEQARVLIKSREAEKMITELENKFEDFCDAEEEQDAIEMGLILAEMQIYQGKYQEAINILHSSFYNSEMMSKDIRPDLYRVAANLMSGNQKEARRIWDDLKSKEEWIYPPTAVPGERQRIPPSITEFEAALRKRKANISRARKGRLWSRR